MIEEKTPQDKYKNSFILQSMVGNSVFDIAHFVTSYQLRSPEYAISSVDVFLASYSLETTILFALLIYKLQKADVVRGT